MKYHITAGWDKIEASLQDNQKDISLFQDQDYLFVVYGYPYYCQSDKWFDAQDLRRHYLNSDEKFLEIIDGMYSLIIVDKTKKKFTLITDRYGIYTLYFYMNSEEIIISENMEEIVSGWDEIVFDTFSIIEHLNFGYKLGEKTHVKGIKQFQGARVYTLNSHLKLEERKYWDLFDITEEQKIDIEEFRTTFNNHIRKATALGNTISLPLTGGRDSRIILSACLPNKHKLHCYTHGPDYHTDIIQARLIAGHFQIPYEQYSLGEDFGKSLLDRAKGNSGFLFGHGSFFDYMHVKNSFEQESKYGDILLTGILGNQLYRHHPIGEVVPETANKEAAAELILKQVPSVFNFRANLFPYYDMLFKGLNGNDIYTHLKENVRSVLDKSSCTEKPLDLTRFFMFDSYCGNHSSNTMRFTGKYFKLIGAFFHKDLLKQFRFADIHSMVNAEIHDYIIKMNSPYLSELKYYNSGRMVKYLKLISNKISVKLLNRQFFKHPDFANYHLWLKNYHLDFLKDLMNYNKMISADLFNRDEFEKVLAMYLLGKTSFTSKKKMFFAFSLERLFINLISIEYWLRDFVKGKKYRFEL